MDRLQRGVRTLVGCILRGAQVGEFASDLGLARAGGACKGLTHGFARRGARGFLGGLEGGRPRLVQLPEEVGNHALERGDGFVAAARAFDLAGKKLDLRLQRGQLIAPGAGGRGAIDLFGEVAHELFEVLCFSGRRVTRRGEALGNGAMQLVEPIAKNGHLLLRGAGRQRGVDTLGQAFDAAFEGAQTFRAHAFGHDRANVGDDARDIRRRYAGGSRALELRGEFTEFALRAFAAVRSDGGARKQVADFAGLLEDGVERLRIRAAARLQILDLGGDGAHVLLERADGGARVELAHGRAQLARKLIDRRGDGVAHALDARDVQPVGYVAHRVFERGDGGAGREFAQAARDRRDFATQLVDGFVVARARGASRGEILAHLLDAVGHADEVALKARERLGGAFGRDGPLETLDDGGEARLQFAGRATLIEGWTRLGAARGEGQRRVAIELALPAHDLRHRIDGLGPRAAGFGRERTNGRALRALRHLRGQLSELGLDSGEPVAVAVATAAFEMGGDLRQLGIDFAQALVAATCIVVMREIVDAALETRQRPTDRLQSRLVMVARDLVLDIGEATRDRLQRAAFAIAIDLRGFDDVDHFGKRAGGLVLAARIAPLVGFQRVLDQALGVLALAPGNLARACVARQATAAAPPVRGEILDAVVVVIAAALLATTARASIVAHAGEARRHGVDIVVVLVVAVGVRVAGAVGNDFIQPFANAHAFALGGFAGCFPRIEAHPLDAPRRRLVHHLIRWTRPTGRVDRKSVRKKRIRQRKQPTVLRPDFRALMVNTELRTDRIRYTSVIELFLRFLHF